MIKSYIQDHACTTAEEQCIYVYKSGPYMHATCNKGQLLRSLAKIWLWEGAAQYLTESGRKAVSPLTATGHDRGPQ